MIEDTPDFVAVMDDDMIKDDEKKPMESHGSLLVSRSPYFEFLSSGKRQEQWFLQANDKNNGFFRQLMPFFSPSTIHSSSLFQD